MLPRGRHATAAGSSPTSNRLVAACIVSFVLVSLCSWCVAQEIIDIGLFDVRRYYSEVSLRENTYAIEYREEPVILLMRTDPESDFETVIRPQGDGELVLTNGWNTDCQLRLEYYPKKAPTWTVYEKGGSEPFPELTHGDIAYTDVMYLVKQADGVKLQWRKYVEDMDITVKDCVLETKSFGDRPVYNLTFTSVPFSLYCNPQTTVFVRLVEPTMTTEEPTSTPEATDFVVTDAPTSSSPKTTTAGTTTTAKRIPKVTSKSAVDTQSPQSHSSPSNVNESSSDTASSESPDSAAAGVELGPLVAAVAVMQLFANVFLRA